MGRLYGVLKTYELEMEQDDEIEKGQMKGGSVALVASVRKLEEQEMEVVVKATPTKEGCEGKIIEAL